VNYFVNNDGAGALPSGGFLSIKSWFSDLLERQAIKKYGKASIYAFFNLSHHLSY